MPYASSPVWGTKALLTLNGGLRRALPAIEPPLPPPFPYPPQFTQTFTFQLAPNMTVFELLKLMRAAIDADPKDFNTHISYLCRSPPLLIGLAGYWLQLASSIVPPPNWRRDARLLKALDAGIAHERGMLDARAVTRFLAEIPRFFGFPDVRRKLLLC